MEAGRSEERVSWAGWAGGMREAASESARGRLIHAPWQACEETGEASGYVLDTQEINEQAAIHDEQDQRERRQQCIEINALVERFRGVDRGDEAVTHPEVQIDAEQQTAETSGRGGGDLGDGKAVVWLPTFGQAPTEHQRADQQRDACCQLTVLDEVAIGDAPRQDDTAHELHIPDVWVVLQPVLQRIGQPLWE